MTRTLRIGIDVGGTFTDAVAIDAATLELVGQVKTPTSHHHPDGVAHGIVSALGDLLTSLDASPDDVVFLAHGTTQATNALLEGDVAPVGLITLGSGSWRWLTGRLRRLSRARIAGGRRLPLHYRHVDRPEDDAAVQAVLADLRSAGVETVVVAQPFSVDAPEGEDRVAEAARAKGFLVTTTHELTSLYGLSKRTRTALLNAVILPRMFATADLVQRSIDRAGITAPLMVMRCDGGVMTLDEMRRRPLLTVLSGPAAGVAGALMQEKLSDGVFLETGGTSPASVVRHGKVATRFTEFGGSSTYLSALDVRTVGVGGGSMVRVGEGAIRAVGPRSAHIAGLPYACFASPDDLAAAAAVLIAPVEGDAADHLVLDGPGGRFAVTMTCAANALGLVPETDYAHADPVSSRLAMEPLARMLGTDVDAAARAVLTAGAKPVQEVVDALVKEYRLPAADLLLVGGGGGAASVTPFTAEKDGRRWRIARHSEVISPIGVALALIREQVERVIPGATDEQILAVRRAAEQAVVAQGAAASTVSVDVTVDPQSNTVRAVATGATELRTQDRQERRDDEALRAGAAASLGVPAAEVDLLGSTDAYAVFGSDRPRRAFRRATKPVRVLDRDGVVRFSSSDAVVTADSAGGTARTLPQTIEDSTSYGDGGSRAPALQLVLGGRIADLSGVVDAGQLVSLARTELDGRPGAEPVVAVLEARR